MTLNRRSWLEQLFTCTQKGVQARRAGLPLTSCPYGPNYTGNYQGFQRQRRQAWQEGWSLADKEIREAQ